MRYESQQKAQTRERIVRTASRKLRAEGLNGAGVESVMRASGLTVGGFYKHFRSKDELLADAIAQGFADSNEKLRSALQYIPYKDKWKQLVRSYLSLEHCNHPEDGCTLATLAPEIARAKMSIRKRISASMKEWVEIMPGVDAEERNRNLLIIYSAMVGALSVARILVEPADKRKVLDGMRDHLLNSF